MKICLISKECFPFFYGGIGAAFYFLGKALNSAGHQVVLLTKKPFDHDQQTQDEYYGDGFQTEWVAYREGQFSPHAALDYAYHVAAHFEKFNESFNADFVLYPEYDGEAFVLLQEKMAGKYPACRFAIHYSGPLSSIFEAEELKASVYERIIFEMEEYCIRVSPLSVAPSFFIRDRIVRQYNLEGQGSILLPNPVNPTFPGREKSAVKKEEDASDGERKILYYGRLQKTKGVDTLILAFQRLLQASPGLPVRLQLIGKDMYWAEYGKSFIDYWKEILPEDVLHRIEFIPQLPHAELHDYIDKAWLAVFPSRFEVFGNVALEAIHSGIPVLVNKSTGLWEVLGPGYGHFWEGLDDESLSRAMLGILTNPSLREKLVAASEKRSEELLAQEQPRLIALVKGFGEAPLGLLPATSFNAAKIISLTNQYSTELLQKKDVEIRTLYAVKNQELDKAWKEIEQKDLLLRKVWEEVDQKSGELRKTWEEIEWKSVELQRIWAELGVKDELLKKVWEEAEAKDLTLQKTWKESEEKDLHLQKAWGESAQKDDLIRELWQRHDEMQEKLSVLQGRLDTLKEEYARQEFIAQDQNKRIQQLWKDLSLQHHESSDLKTAVAEMKNVFEKKEKENSELGVILNQCLQELNTIKKSWSYLAAKKFEGNLGFVRKFRKLPPGKR